MNKIIETNTVYFSNTLPEEFPQEFQQLSKIITDSGYKVKLLVGSEDFYCRDFMPVQVAKNDFVQFVFRPEAYLKGEELQYLTDPTLVQLMTPGLTKPRYSPLILDGGNVIKWEDKALVTDRVLKDNRYQFPSDEAIIERLEFDLKCKVIIIPEYPNEETGHADGLVRFIDGNTVFINETHEEPEREWLQSFLRVLLDNDILHIKLPCDVNPQMNTAEGLYLNYLHVGDLIIVPQFGVKQSDKRALDTFNELFSNTYKIVPLKANWIAKEGGVFNCMSWVVKG